MLLIVFNPEELKFEMVLQLSYGIIIIYLCVGLMYMIKNKAYGNRAIVPCLWTLMLILFPILILIVPSLMVWVGGYIFATVILLWDLGIISVIFIIIIYLINSQRNLSLETKVERPDTEKNGVKGDSGLRTGAIIIIVCTIIIILFSIIITIMIV